MHHYSKFNKTLNTSSSECFKIMVMSKTQLDSAGTDDLAPCLLGCTKRNTTTYCTAHRVRVFVWMHIVPLEAVLLIVLNKMHDSPAWEAMLISQGFRWRMKESDL